MPPFLTDSAYVTLIILHFMISVRILALILPASVFMLPTLPNPVKFWLAVMLSMIVTPVSDASIVTEALGSLSFLLVMAVR